MSLQEHFNSDITATLSSSDAVYCVVEEHFSHQLGAQCRWLIGLCYLECKVCICHSQSVLMHVTVSHSDQ